MRFFVFAFALFTALGSFAGEPACMTYEKGVGRGCEYLEDPGAERFCIDNFGAQYLPFVADSGKCSLVQASKLRGEVHAKEMLDGLASQMDEVEAIITMIDRKDLNSAIAGFAEPKPKIGNEFYTDVVKALMAKMNMLKGRIFKNGSLNVSDEQKVLPQYIEFVKRYMGVLARLHKVYAFVAHENHFVLKSYNFENLDYLNLKLKKEHALMALKKVKYSAKTLEGGESVELSIGQQEKQAFERQAMQDPQSKKDYAKLVSYMGIRENLTNLWAVQRMSEDDLFNEQVRSCGNFLSFRPGKGGDMKESAAYKELVAGDLYMNDYSPRIEEVFKATLEESLLTKRSSMDLGDYILRNVGELKQHLQNMDDPVESREEFMDLAKTFSSLHLDAENAHWAVFGAYNFSSILLEGDKLATKSDVADQIVEEVYRRRLDGVTSSFLRNFGIVSDKSLDEMEKKLRWFSDKYLKSRFVKRLKKRVMKALDGYADLEEFARVNRQKKEKETLEAAKQGVLAASVMDAINKGSLKFNRRKTLEPASFEELMVLFQDRIEKSYFDLRQTMAHNPQLSKMLKDFLKDIQDDFNGKFGDSIVQASREERAQALRESAYRVARKWFATYPYEISHNRLREYPTLKDQASSIPVYKDGSPAAMSDFEFLNSVSKKENYVMARKAHPLSYLGATEPIKRDVTRANEDKLSAGKMGRPLEVVSPGVIKNDAGEAEINNAKLVELYKEFAILSGRSKKALENPRYLPAPENGFFGSLKETVGTWLGKTEKALNTTKYLPKTYPVEKSLVITNPAKLLFRTLEVLRLEDVGMRSKVSGHFARDIDAQKVLAGHLIQAAYQASAILRQEKVEEVKDTKVGFVRGTERAYTYEGTKEVSVPLLTRIAREAFNPKTGRFNSGEAKDMIQDAVDRAIENTPEKLSKFCGVNYMNYVNDPDFKDVYKASGYLRSILKAGVGLPPDRREKIAQLDEAVKKDIRGKWEAWNEDVIEPLTEILGYTAMAGVVLLLVLGTGGAAVPAVLALHSVVAGFVAWEFVVSFPLMMASNVINYNSHFIETPVQLKFQESIATSQVGESKVVHWDRLNQDKEALKGEQGMWSVMLPLQGLFGYMLFRHIKFESGMDGLEAAERLTGLKYKGWSGLPGSMVSNPKVKVLRKKIGFTKALGHKVARAVNRGKAFMPKYQAVPEELIKSIPLRMGIVRTAKKLGIADKPWFALNDITAHAEKLGARLKQFKSYRASEEAFVEKVRLKGMLKPNEIMKHFNKTSFVFIPSTLLRRVKNLDGKGIVRFFTRFGDVWEELKVAQGMAIKSRVDGINAVADKLRAFQKASFRGEYQGDNQMQRFLETLTDNEILALEEVAKASKGIFGNFKSVFKDHQKVIMGLRPMEKLLGYTPQSYANPVYSQTYVLNGYINPKYAFESDAEDLVNFYQSTMRNGVKSNDLNEVRERVEAAFARSVKFENGKFVEL